MGLNNFQIIFDKPDKVYKPGDTLSGIVVIEIDSIKSISAINIMLKGRTKTHWSRSSGKTSTHYKGEETYFKKLIYFVTLSNDESLELQPGKHTYEFSFNLPGVLELPSSYVGTNGNVVYSAKVTIERPWKLDHTTKNVFFITQPLDLNQISLIKNPVTVSFERQYWFCFKSGQVECRIKVPCTGFVSGQTAPFILEIDNKSPIKVIGLNIKLKSYATSYTTSKQNNAVSVKKLLTQHINVRIPANTFCVYAENIIIPHTEVYNLENCKLIDIIHKFKFVLIMSGIYCNLYGEVPIVIGHIPLNYVTPIENLNSVVREMHN